MRKDRRSLPDFAKPPVIEVALAIQFDPLTGLRTAYWGLLWTELRNRFPKLEEHPPHGPVMEKFGIPSTPTGKVQFKVLEAMPVSRCWFLNETGSEMIQVQQDRFVFNWRKLDGEAEYPRYPHVREAFATNLTKFSEFVQRERLGELIANQCEVTYVNRILPGAGWKEHSEIGKVITTWESRYSEDFLPEPENVNVAVRYIIPDRAGNPAGRLHVSVEPASQDVQGDPMFVMKLTARGKPDEPTIESALRFLDLGREWIVRGFAALTTERMHKIWERQDDN